MSQFTDPEHAHSALITIDVQCDTLDGEPFEIPGTSAILPRIGQLAAAFRSSGSPIIHVVRLYESDKLTSQSMEGGGKNRIGPRGRI